MYAFVSPLVIARPNRPDRTIHPHPPPSSPALPPPIRQPPIPNLRRLPARIPIRPGRQGQVLRRGDERDELHAIPRMWDVVSDEQDGSDQGSCGWDGQGTAGEEEDWQGDREVFGYGYDVVTGGCEQADESEVSRVEPGDRESSACLRRLEFSLVYPISLSVFLSAFGNPS